MFYFTHPCDMEEMTRKTTQAGWRRPQEQRKNSKNPMTETVDTDTNLHKREM